MLDIMPTPATPLRITFLTPPANLSGGLKVVGIYANLLQQRGHCVRIISPAHPSISLKHKIKTLLKKRNWPTKNPNLSHFSHFHLDHHILEKHRPITNADVPDGDVVIATWWETAEWVAALEPSKGVKVYFIQGYEVFRHLPVERCKRTYSLPLHKIVIARWLLHLMRDEYHDHDVDLVPNSVDHQQFFAPIRDKQARPTVGFLYSPSSNKGISITLAAIKTLSASFPNLRIISFGAHPVSHTENWMSNIEFRVAPPQDEIRHLYAQCDVWLTASRSEGFNLPAMEAMACRTPVVSTRTGWPEEAIVDGHNGFLVDIDDVDGMSNAATTILSSDNQQWRQHSANAFATVEHNSWQTSTDLFEQALRRAITKPAATQPPHR